MKLTLVERWILANQYQLLELMDPENKTHYEKVRNILERGYEFLYDDEACPIYQDTFSFEEGKLVVDILDMFRGITVSLKKIEDQSGLPLDRLKFDGFDGNNEGKYMLFAEFFCEKLKRFEEITKNLASFNSHTRRLQEYVNMFVFWKGDPNPFELSRESLLSIAEARY